MIFDIGGRNASYLLISSLVFAIVHWEKGLANMLSAGVLGFLAAVLYLEMKYLLPMMVVHFVINLYLFAPKSL